MPDYGKEVRDILLKHGCQLHRQGKGSHEIWRSPIVERYITVPVKILSRHTANAIMKQAGLDKTF